MAGGSLVSEKDPKFRFTGAKFYFNTFTNRGRLNTFLANLSLLILPAVIIKMNGARKKRNEDKKFWAEHGTDK